jgi:arylsulfatase A-like enzyme
VAGKRYRYGREVEFVDRHIGRLLDELDRRGKLDNTLLIFTSDHGEGLGDHNHVGHISQLYDTLINVPLAFVFPGRLPAGKVIDEPVALADVAPTIADLLGIPIIKNTSGRSLVPLITGGSLAERPVIAETFRPEAYADRRAIVAEGHKYIYSRRDEEREELYDLASDPDELEDLSKAKPELMARLRDRLHEILKRRGEVESVDAELSEDDRAQLRALGYIH